MEEKQSQDISGSIPAKDLLYAVCHILCLLQGFLSVSIPSLPSKDKWKNLKLLKTDCYLEKVWFALDTEDDIVSIKTTLFAMQ